MKFKKYSVFSKKFVFLTKSNLFLLVFKRYVDGGVGFLRVKESCLGIGNLFFLNRVYFQKCSAIENN